MPPAASLPALAFLALVSYLVGSIPWAYLLARRLRGIDIRTVGTGNVGAMNVHRATGSKALGGAAALLDAGKGILALLLASQVARVAGVDLVWAQGTAATAVVLGHNHSLFLGFNSGKGLSTGAGALLFMHPWMLGAWGAVFFATVGVTRYLVLGQILATAALPLLALLTTPGYLGAIGVPVALILTRHLPRLRDVLRGTEPRMYYRIRE